MIDMDNASFHTIRMRQKPRRGASNRFYCGSGAFTVKMLGNKRLLQPIVPSSLDILSDRRPAKLSLYDPLRYGVLSSDDRYSIGLLYKTVKAALFSSPAVPTRPAALFSRPAVLRRKLQRLCLRLTARQSPATLAGVVPTAQPSPSARFRRGLLPLDS